MKSLSKVTRFFCLFLLVTGVLVTWCPISFADIPKTLNFQAKLTDKIGVPLTGTYQIGLAIYDSQTAGNLLWQETQSAIVYEGIANLILGRITPLSIAFDKQYWLEITINTEKLPQRQPLSSSAYSLNSERLAGIPAGNFLHTDVNGNVGIGITNPTALLHIAGSSAGGYHEVARFNGSRGLNKDGSYISFGSDPYPTWRRGAIGARYDSATSWGSDLFFHVNQGRSAVDLSDAMIIKYTGNVGIGTINPQEKLHVAGKIKAQEFITGDITFTNKQTGRPLWNMYEDENGLYLKSAVTGKSYKFVLEEIK